ncbi:hypothetical protein MMC29_005944 [Sticta canariensis]|nr:hypothetical protein [Sticta canariensis]
MSTINGARTESTNELCIRDYESKAKSPGAGIDKANSVAAIKEALVQLHHQETSVRDRLDTLVASQKSLSRELARLDVLRAHLGSHAVTARSISNGMLSNAASTANRISGAVKQLDLEQSRVISTLDVVEQVAELKACVLGVTGSMGAPQDWETAAAYLSRASNIPDEIVSGSFAEEIVPTAEVPDPPKVTLGHAAESLCGLFLREFEKAAQENNGAKVTRFFKLFPLIGKPDVGLDIYGRYVCQGVASRARANLHAGVGANQRKEGLFYANALTKLFEHVAQIVEHHGALVERHYGAGRMVRVIERLQLEADIQGGIILDTWTDERNIDRKLTDIRSYAFTFLVQSFLPVPPARSGTPLAGSPANRAVAETQARDDEGADMKEIDGFLSEIALMLGRWSLYSRFIAAKCKSSSAVPDDELQPLYAPQLLPNSSLSRKVADRLVLPFNTLTTFFFRRSVEKAFQLDELPLDLSLDQAKPLSSNPPFITSAVDDVMYIVNQVVERSISTSNRIVISSAIPSVARVLGSDFIGMIQRKMRDESYPKSAIPGAFPPEQTIISFLVLINNLDVATDYVKRIVQSRAEGPSGAMSTYESETTSSTSLATLFPFNNDAVFVSTTLKALQQSFESKTTELIGDGIHVVFKNVIKPRLRPILADTFRDTDYQMTHEDVERVSREAEAEDGDRNSVEAAVSRHFQRGWDNLTKPVARILTDRNYDRVRLMILSYLNEVLEKRIWSYYGRLNDLGAARLERDIASIVGISVMGGRYGLREVFARCTQICLVMNMEEDEWDELRASSVNGNDSDFDWKIDGEERIRARAMRRDSKGS